MNKTRFRQFIRLVEKLKTVTRHSWTSNKKRQESVAEHSWMLSLLALLSLHHLKNKGLDHLKILKLAIIHNIAESIAGDIPTHDQDGKDTKQKVERVALKKIASNLPEDMREELIALWEEFEAQETEESKIVEALDKIEVGFQHCVAHISTWDENDRGYPTNYAEELCRIDPFLEELNKINMEWRRRKLEEEKH